MITQQPLLKTGSNGPVPPPSPKPARAERKRRRIPGWVLWAAVAAAAGLGWFFWTRSHAGQNNAGNMITATVTRGNLVEAVSATGSVTAARADDGVPAGAGE